MAEPIKAKFVKQIYRVQRCVPKVSKHDLATRISNGLFHRFVNHDYNRIQMAQKKVLQLKNRGNL